MSKAPVILSTQNPPKESTPPSKSSKLEPPSLIPAIKIVSNTIDPAASSDSSHTVHILGGISPVLSPHELKEVGSGVFSEFQRVRLDTTSRHLTEESRQVCRQIRQAVRLRDEWVGELNKRYYPNRPLDDPDSLVVEKNEIGSKSYHSFKWENGVVHAWEGEESDKIKDFECPKTVDNFYQDLHWLMNLATSGPAKTFCFNRMKILESRFKLHIFLNEANETQAQKESPHRDFYNVRKVDNHVHHSACMNQKHLLRFMKSRLKHAGHKHVQINPDTNKPMTLREVFESLELNARDLNLDKLDMHGHRDTRHRFDRFNLKYNPVGASELRTLFLKHDNYIGGEFLAQVTQEVFSDLEEAKYQFAEYRLSIYGKDPNEWDRLAHWVCKYKLHSSNVRWMIQIPRIYNVYKSKNLVTNFGEMLENIFNALFEVTIDPSSHPELFLFLQHVVALDSVDDESKREIRKDRRFPEPSKWDRRSNPPYSYWSYYIWANLTVLNKLRLRKGYNTFAYRPHAGEAGDVEHLAVTFLCAHAINHGINLVKTPVLQYLYYVKQIGISMSPLSNNLLFLDYDKSPFLQFFQCGMNITLSTDDPLMIHFTKEPLVEEYSVAAQVLRLSSTDMCEVARNSVIQSGFEHHLKQHWIGESYEDFGVSANDVERCNVPDIRIKYRCEVLAEELQILSGDNDVVRESERTSLTDTTFSLPPGKSQKDHVRYHWPPAGREPRKRQTRSPAGGRSSIVSSYYREKGGDGKNVNLETKQLILFGAAAFFSGYLLSKLKRKT